MFRFTKEETFATLLIFLIVASVSYFNFKDALMRARDSTRKDDLGAIHNALSQFHEDFGYFPPSDKGKIKYCKGDNFDRILEEISADPDNELQNYFEGLRSCEWGKDSFDDLLDDDYPPYLERLPQDPKSDEGIQYHYISNLNRYQIYTHLEEGQNAPGYSSEIVDRDLECGSDICSFGRSYANTPLDISLEEYEAILEQERLERLQN